MHTKIKHVTRDMFDHAYMQISQILFDSSEAFSNPNAATMQPLFLLRLLEVWNDGIIHFIISI